MVTLIDKKFKVCCKSCIFESINLEIHNKLIIGFVILTLLCWKLNIQHDRTKTIPSSLFQVLLQTMNSFLTCQILLLLHPSLMVDHHGNCPQIDHRDLCLVLGLWHVQQLICLVDKKINKFKTYISTCNQTLPPPHYPLKRVLHFFL